MRKRMIFFVLFAASVVLFVMQTLQAFGIVAFHADFFAKKGTVVLDAGHGGEDGGAVGDNGVLEKDINLAIALELEKYLKQNNFDVIMVRSSDVSVGDSSFGYKGQTSHDIRGRGVHSDQHSSKPFFSKQVQRRTGVLLSQPFRER